MHQRLIHALRLSLMSAVLIPAADRDSMSQDKVRPSRRQKSFTVFASPDGRNADAIVDQKRIADLKTLLSSPPINAKVRIAKTIEEAAESQSEVLLLFMNRSNQEYSRTVLDGIKKQKVIGIGYGVAQLYGEMGLEINGGACAHFGANPPDVRFMSSRLLGDLTKEEPFSAYKKEASSDNFGLYIPAGSELMQVVDVIARLEGRSSNYAPIVRQGKHVLVGLSAAPSAWSDDFKSLVWRLSLTLAERRPQDFEAAEFKITKPGTCKLELAKSRSTDKPFGRSFYFRFKLPTAFKATLRHEGSGSMMLLFMGQKNRLKWTRRDAKDGAPLEISHQITEQDLKQIGDRYWMLNVTNFDRMNTARAELKIEYDVPQKSTPGKKATK